MKVETGKSYGSPGRLQPSTPPPPKKFFWAYPSPWRFCRRLARLAARPAAPSLVVDVWGSYLNFLWNFTPTLEDPVDGWDGWMMAGLSASRRNFFEKHVLLYESFTNQDITLKFGQLVLWTISIKCGLLLHDGFLPLRGRKMSRKVTTFWSRAKNVVKVSLDGGQFFQTF